LSRSLTAALADELAKDGIRPCLFLEGQFTSGFLRVWSGLGPVNWNGYQWLGIGTLGTISPMAESADVKANGVTISLNGIPNDLIAKMLNEVRQGYPVKIWFGCLDSVGNVIADPYQAFGGRMDVPTIDEGATTSTISISVENRLIDLQKPRERRYTHEDQQISYPGDLGFQYVPQIQDWNGTWGKAGSGGHLQPVGGGGSSGGGGRGRGVGGGGGGGCVMEGTFIQALTGEYHYELAPEDKWFLIQTENGMALCGNAEHPVYVRFKGEVRMPDVKVGDELITKRGISKVSKWMPFARECNKMIVSVPEGNLYWANGILSHNKRRE
jgi:hypothetical protein